MLDFGYNEVQVLPPSFGCSRKLQNLNMEANRLTELPGELINMHLEVLKYDKNRVGDEVEETNDNKPSVKMTRPKFPTLKMLSAESVLKHKK
jgi:Leucine-rich repeat (LRR) protein